MKPREEGGVVDGRLNVYGSSAYMTILIYLSFLGTQNLKCVDLSICPDNLGTNTYSSALYVVSISHMTFLNTFCRLVGEKGADLIAEELGSWVVVDDQLESDLPQDSRSEHLMRLFLMRLSPRVLLPPKWFVKLLRTMVCV